MRWKALPEAGHSRLTLPHLPPWELPTKHDCPTQSRAATSSSSCKISRYREASPWKPCPSPSILASIYTYPPASRKRSYPPICPKWRSSAGTLLKLKSSFPSLRLRKRIQGEVQTIDGIHWTATTALLVAATLPRRPSRWTWKAPCTSIQNNPDSGERCMIPASASGSQVFWG